MYQIVKSKNSKKATEYGLINKMISASDLSQNKIDELLSQDDSLHTSNADCVLKCAQRIREAAEKGEKVFIGGDYDTDGICATTILKATLDRMGITNGYYIPNRILEGYGLHAHIVDMVADRGYGLIITVDNGVKAHAAIRQAHERGVDIIVTDHHEINEPVDVDILVHPNYMEPEYKYLCGAGVALEISRNLIGNQDDLNALAAVAHIGDVMEFWEETRRIIKNGIRQIKAGKVPVFTRLLTNTNRITNTDISFQIVPKLNSAGRLAEEGNVNVIVKGLLAKDPDNADAMARYLEDLNDVRKQHSEAMTAKAEEMIDANEKAVVLFDESFSEGMNGLVAGRITNKYGRPSIVFSSNGDNIKGSARSVPGVNIFEIISRYDKLVAFGGHEMAAGIAIRKDDFEDFKEFFCHEVEKCNAEQILPKALLIDPDDISTDAIDEIEHICPIPKELCCTFAIPYRGQKPSFSAAKVKKYRFINKNGPYEAIIFSFKNITPVEGYLVGTLNNNVYNGKTTPQMIVEDCTPA